MAIYTVANPGNGNDIFANVQAAVNSCAASGDSIVLPAGSFTFSGQITTSKKFNLYSVLPATCIWSGFVNDYSIESPLTLTCFTTLYRSESMSDISLGTLDTSAAGGTSGSPALAMFKFNDPSGSPQTSVTTDGIVISDIEFKSKIPSLNGYPANGGTNIAPDGGSVAADYCLYFNKSVDFKITRCSFKYFGNAAINYTHWDSVARGVIYKCNFDQNAKGADGLGLGYGIVVYGQNLVWSTNPKFGSNNFLFIENCSFNLHRHSVSGGGNGRFVVRYCYIQDNIVTYFRSCQAIDAHGRRGGSLGSGNYFSTHAVEAYNNKIINQYRYDSTHTSAKVLIGGTTNEDDLIERGVFLKECFHLSYNNIIKGYRFGTGVQIETINIYSDGNTGYPQKFTFGQPSAITGGASNPNGDLGDSWIWNNTVHILNGNCANFYNATPSIFQANRDYHLSAYAYTNADSTGSGSAYTYPHPLRDDLTPPVITGTGRTFSLRTFHAR